MPIRLFTKGSENAHKLIKEGKIDTHAERIDHHTGQTHIQEYLKNHSVQEYGLWCLATNKHAPENSPEHYLYPYGDFQNVKRSMVIDIEREAGKHRHLDIVAAAQELLKRIDK
jgi:hypothetical protein